MNHNRIENMFHSNGNNSHEPTPPTEVPPKTGLEIKQDVLRAFTSMLATDQADALMVVGPGGNGKSTVVTETLSAHGILPIIINNHLTPVGLLQLLWEYRSERILLIEDAEQCNQGAIIGLLRSATEGVNGRRLVTYTTSQEIGVPRIFEFESKIILCANAIPKNPMFEALVSRCLTYRLEPTRDDILEQFRKETRNGCRVDELLLPPALCKEVISFVDHSASRSLSMRLLRPVFRTVAFAVQQGLDWQELLNAQLQTLTAKTTASPTRTSRDEDLEVIKQVQEEHPNSVQDQIVAWCAMTGKSRPTYFRLKKKLLEENE